MIKVVLVMWTTDVSYTFNIWVDGSIYGSLTYNIGKGLDRWSITYLLSKLISNDDNCKTIERLMEDKIAEKAIEREILS